jgi:hypothetical protein
MAGAAHEDKARTAVEWTEAATKARRERLGGFIRVRGEGDK